MLRTSIRRQAAQSPLPFLWVWLLWALTLSQGVAAQDNFTIQSKPVPEITAISDAMQPFVDCGEVSGVATFVGHKGEVVHVSALGHANQETEKPMRGTSLFAIASMTKPITATALMILVEEGKVSLDDNVSQYLPALADVKLKNGDALERQITIRDCITHTSGLSGKQTFPGTLAEHIDELAARPLGFQPGTKWQYSPGMNVVGRIVEIVAQQPLEEFMRERIFGPLRMPSTRFKPTEGRRKRLAVLYGPAEEDDSTKAETSKNERNQDGHALKLVPVANRIGDLADVKGINPSGGLVSCGRDMLRFYQMILNGGTLRNQKIVSQESVRMMTSNQTGKLKTGFTPGNCWGLGWCVIAEPQGVSGMLSPGSFGHGGAFGTQGWVDPKTETIYVLMIQRTGLKNSDDSELRKAFQQAASDALNLAAIR